jgi:hypothetical protein
VKLTNRQPGLLLLLTGITLTIAATGCGDRIRPAPRVEVTTPGNTQSADVIISYVLYDTESLPANITVQYSLNGGTTYAIATEGTGGDGITGLFTNERGIAHSFVWDSITDAGYVNEDNVTIAISATTRKTALASVTGNFSLENFNLGIWEPNIRIDDDTGVTTADSPKIAAEADNIYVVWTDYRNGDADIYFSSSTDTGTTWATSVRVCNDTSNQVEPALAHDGSGNIYVVWTDYRNLDTRVYMATGNNPGSGFVFGVSSEVTSASALTASQPVITVEGSDLYVAWTDYRNGHRDIYFCNSTNAGTTWETEILLNDDGSVTNQYEPSIAADGSGNVYVAWSDARNGSYDIYCSSGSNPGSGFVFSANVRVDDDTGIASATEPAIAVNGTNIYVAYTDQRNLNQDIYLAVSTDSAVTFATNLKASDDSGTAAQYLPTIALNGTTELYVAFVDERSDGPSIYFTSSTIPVASFTANIRIDSDPSQAVQTHPDITYGSRIFAVFTDGRNTNNDIYFTRRPKN